MKGFLLYNIFINFEMYLSMVRVLEHQGMLLRRVYLLKKIHLCLIKIFTTKDCFYFTFMMPVVKF